METVIKYIVSNLNKRTTQHQGRASRLLMLRVQTASDTVTDLYLTSKGTQLSTYNPYK